MLEELASLHKLHYEVQFGRCLESIRQIHKVRVVDVGQHHFFSFGVFNLILLDNILFVQRLHSKKFLCVFFLNQKNCPEGSLPKNKPRYKIGQTHGLLVILRIEGFCCFPDLFFLLLLTLKIFLKALIVILLNKIFCT